MDFKSIVEGLSAALTPVIAVVAIYIAYQQHRINKTRLTLACYDRRMAVFKAVKALYGEIGSAGTANYKMVLKFQSATAEAEFLFSKDKKIEEHLEDIYKKGLHLASLQEKMYPSSGEPGLPVGEERSKVAEEHSELLGWFLQDAQSNTRKHFGKYLRLS